MEFVDLGLSVKWAACNVGADTATAFGDYFTFEEAQNVKKQDGARLPTYAELVELVNDCHWSMKGDFTNLLGCTVIGRNGNSIFIPAAGDGNEWTVGHGADLWSCEELDFGEAHSLHIRMGEVFTEAEYMANLMSVRLVKD